MGMFVNAVLLYSDLSDNPPFAEFLERTRQHILEDAAYHDTPFPAIVKGLRAETSPAAILSSRSSSPSTTVPSRFWTLRGIRGTITERHNKTAKADMTVICIPRAEQHATLGTLAPLDEDFTLIWEYNSDIFERDTIEQMIQHYVTLLRRIVLDPRLRVRDLKMVSDVETRNLLELSAGERVQYPREKTIHGFFEEQVRRHPDTTAVIHDGKALSYLELNSRANRLARQLRQTYQEKLGAPLEAWDACGDLR